MTEPRTIKQVEYMDGSHLLGKSVDTLTEGPYGVTWEASGKAGLIPWHCIKEVVYRT